MAQRHSVPCALGLPMGRVLGSTGEKLTSSWLITQESNSQMEPDWFLNQCGNSQFLQLWMVTPRIISCLPLVALKYYSPLFLWSGEA